MRPVMIYPSKHGTANGRRDHMKWIVLMTLLQANGAATQHEIPTPPYVRDQVTCATYMKAIAKDYNSYHGLSVDSARCMEYRS
jgi:hypothetical protein